MHPDAHDREEWARQGLVPLSELPGARMADDEPSLLGWDVVAPSGATVGRVDDLLVNRSAGEIEAVLVTAAARSGGRHLTLPIDRVDVDERDHRVVARDGDALLALDRRGGDARGGDARGGGRADDAREPRHADAGREPRPLADGDRVGLDDVPQRDGAAAGAPPTEVTVERTADGGEVVRVPVVEERLVVERRPVVTDVLVIRKRAVARDAEVEADLRRERVDVERRDFPDGG